MRFPLVGDPFSRFLNSGFHASYRSSGPGDGESVYGLDYYLRKKTV